MKLVRWLLVVVAYAGLSLVIIPAVLVFNAFIDIDTSKQLMAVGTALWFVAFGITQYGGRK